MKEEKKKAKAYCCIYNPATGSMPTAIQRGPQETQLFFNLGKCLSTAKKILIQSSCRISGKKKKNRKKKTPKNHWGVNIAVR